MKFDLQSLLKEKEGGDSNAYFFSSELPSLGEDSRCFGKVGGFYCYGIFDGHSGPYASKYVAGNLLNEMKKTYSLENGKWSYWLKSFYKDTFDDVVRHSFLNLDHKMISEPLKALEKRDFQLAAKTLPTALNGSCALLAMYNPSNRLLKTALTGDSRAVFGMMDKNHQWHAYTLTKDQTGANEDEAQRIRSEHPTDPPDIVQRGRVLGYEPSRTFGDAVTKWSKDVQVKLKEAFYVNRHNPLLNTPPYLTAEPVVSTIKVPKRSSAFLVLGCDGLFEWLTDKQVVELVGDWLSTYHPNIQQSNLPVIEHDLLGSDSKESNKLAIRPQMLNWGELKKTVADPNAATHLIRNALGGADAEKVALFAGIPAPLSRRHRDDISCTVVFFDETGFESK